MLGLLTPVTVQGQLTNMRELELRFLTMPRAPAGLLDMPQLSKLTLLRLTFTEEDWCWSSPLPKLTHLTVSECEGINDVPAQLCSTALKELDLQGNSYLDALPDELTIMTNLLSLELSHNSFSTIPPQVSSLPQLTQLALVNQEVDFQLHEPILYFCRFSNLNELCLYQHQQGTPDPLTYYHLGQLASFTTSIRRPKLGFHLRV